MKNLSILSYANGFSIWHYKTERDITEVLNNSYFAQAIEMFSLNDCIYILAKHNGKQLLEIYQCVDITKNTLELRKI